MVVVWQEDPPPSSFPTPDWNSDHMGSEEEALGSSGKDAPPNPHPGTGSQLIKAGLGDDRSAIEHLSVSSQDLPALSLTRFLQ